MLKTLAKRIVNHEDQDSWSAKMRQRRMAFFRDLLATVDDSIELIDVGGTPIFWQNRRVLDDERVSITVVNLLPFASPHPRIHCIRGDATQLDFPDKKFDVAFSNSVIEHVGSFEKQSEMAREVIRVATAYYVQTPNYWFPIEPHFLFPGFQWLPISMRAWMHNRFRVGWMHREPDYDKARQVVVDTRLLKKGEFRQLFPDASVYHEKLFGLTKSFVAYSGWRD